MVEEKTAYAALSAVPDVLKDGKVLDKLGADAAIGTTVDVGGVAHTVVVATHNAQATGVMLDGSTYFALDADKTPLAKRGEGESKDPVLVR